MLPEHRDQPIRLVGDLVDDGAEICFAHYDIVAGPTDGHDQIHLQWATAPKSTRVPKRFGLMGRRKTT
jgi:hypothetical protein